MTKEQEAEVRKCVYHLWGDRFYGPIVLADGTIVDLECEHVDEHGLNFHLICAGRTIGGAIIDVDIWTKEE